MAGAIVAGVVGAIVIVGALTLLIRRKPDALPLLAIFALPFRLPISADGRTVNLLVPLYLVVAAGVLAQLLPRALAWLGGQRGDPSGPAYEQPVDGAAELERGSFTSVRAWLTPRGLELILLAAVVLYALQGTYSSDHAKAAENLVFFYLPFGLMFLLLRDVRWTRRLLLACLGVAVALALLFAGVGFVEYARKELFLNPKVVAANEFDNYFRVNSVFFDRTSTGASWRW